MNKDLFGNDVPIDPIKVKGKRIAEVQHAQLIKINGERPAFKCKCCEHLYSVNNQGKYLKCANAKQTHSESTDWRANWMACGLFEHKNK